jgi:hypothetical protein
MKGRNHSEDLGVGERIILKYILGKRCWERMNWIRLAENTELGRLLQNGNETSGFTTGRELSTA